MMIFTIGYEGLNINKFISLLTDHDVETVVDIRALPLSRKLGFSKRALASVLNLAGMEYVHKVGLGCPKPVRDRYREDGNWKRYTDGFLNHLKTQAAAIDELSVLVRSSNCALLCFEADYNFCHRSMVANAVRDYCGAEIMHIQAMGSGARTAKSGGAQLAFA